MQNSSSRTLTNKGLINLYNLWYPLSLQKVIFSFLGGFTLSRRAALNNLKISLSNKKSLINRVYVQETNYFVFNLKLNTSTIPCCLQYPKLKAQRRVPYLLIDICFPRCLAMLSPGGALVRHMSLVVVDVDVDVLPVSFECR